jgi:hypothetical protein
MLPDKNLFRLLAIKMASSSPLKVNDTSDQPRDDKVPLPLVVERPATVDDKSGGMRLNVNVAIEVFTSSPPVFSPRREVNASKEVNGTDISRENRTINDELVTVNSNVLNKGGLPLLADMACQLSNKKNIEIKELMELARSLSVILEDFRIESFEIDDTSKNNFILDILRSIGKIIATIYISDRENFKSTLNDLGDILDDRIKYHIEDYSAQICDGAGHVFADHYLSSSDGQGSCENLEKIISEETVSDFQKSMYTSFIKFVLEKIDKRKLAIDDVRTNIVAALKKTENIEELMPLFATRLSEAQVDVCTISSLINALTLSETFDKCVTPFVKRMFDAKIAPQVTFDLLSEVFRTSDIDADKIVGAIHNLILSLPLLSTIDEKKYQARIIFDLVNNITEEIQEELIESDFAIPENFGQTCDQCCDVLIEQACLLPQRECLVALHAIAKIVSKSLGSTDTCRKIIEIGLTLAEERVDDFLFSTFQAVIRVSTDDDVNWLSFIRKLPSETQEAFEKTLLFRLVDSLQSYNFEPTEKLNLAHKIKIFMGHGISQYDATTACIAFAFVVNGQYTVADLGEYFTSDTIRAIFKDCLVSEATRLNLVCPHYISKREEKGWATLANAFCEMISTSFVKDMLELALPIRVSLHSAMVADVLTHLDGNGLPSSISKYLGVSKLNECIKLEELIPESEKRKRAAFYSAAQKDKNLNWARSNWKDMSTEMRLSVVQQLINLHKIHFEYEAPENFLKTYANDFSNDIGAYFKSEKEIRINLSSKRFNSFHNVFEVIVHESTHAYQHLALVENLTTGDIYIDDDRFLQASLIQGSFLVPFTTDIGEKLGIPRLTMDAHYRNSLHEVHAYSYGGSFGNVQARVDALFSVDGISYY